MIIEKDMHHVQMYVHIDISRQMDGAEIQRIL